MLRVSAVDHKQLAVELDVVGVPVPIARLLLRV
jgi:hypothetical protein